MLFKLSKWLFYELSNALFFSRVTFIFPNKQPHLQNVFLLLLNGYMYTYKYITNFFLCGEARKEKTIYLNKEILLWHTQSCKINCITSAYLKSFSFQKI